MWQHVPLVGPSIGFIGLPGALDVVLLLISVYQMYDWHCQDGCSFEKKHKEMGMALRRQSAFSLNGCKLFRFATEGSSRAHADDCVCMPT